MFLLINMTILAPPWNYDPFPVIYYSIWQFKHRPKVRTPLMKLRGLEEGQMIFQICNQFLLISRSKEDFFLHYTSCMTVLRLTWNQHGIYDIWKFDRRPKLISLAKYVASFYLVSAKVNKILYKQLYYLTPPCSPNPYSWGHKI